MSKEQTAEEILENNYAFSNEKEYTKEVILLSMKQYATLKLQEKDNTIRSQKAMIISQQDLIEGMTKIEKELKEDKEWHQEKHSEITAEKVQLHLEIVDLNKEIERLKLDVAYYKTQYYQAIN